MLLAMSLGLQQDDGLGGQCPFCRIVRGEDSAAVVVAEAEQWIAFFPKDPATKGHTLVVPRKHVPDFWGLSPVLAGELAAAAVDVGRALQRLVVPEGMNMITSSGHAAEQTVLHVHLHVLPRWEDDAVDRIWPDQGASRHAGFGSLAADLRALLGRPIAG